MPRTLNPTTYAVRREAFLDVAERLIRTKGYEQMSVQDILDELDASKGAFYHYFGSKEALLEAVIERMTDAAVVLLEPVVNDPDLSAPEKLQAVFSQAGRWKAQRSDLLLGLMRSWYSAENDLVRLRVARVGAARITPLLCRIVHQGTAEGAFSLASPDHTAEILVALLYGSGDAVGRLLLDRRDGLVPFEQVEGWVAAYNQAIERILGLPAGSFVLIDTPSLHVWFD